MMRLHEALRIKKGLPPDSLHDMLFSRKLLGIPEKTSTVTGYPCVLENSVGKPVLSYKISGNIVQNGTPSPDAPVEVQGVGQLVTEGEHSGEYEISVVSRGKNLLKFYTYDKVLTYGGLTITIENNGIITINGRIVFSNIWVEIGYKFGGGTDYQYTPIISLSPNTDYTLSSKVISGTCSEQRQFSLGGYLDGTTQVQNFICKFGTASTFNSGAFLFDRIFLSLGSYGTIYDNYRIQLQLELGTTATPYEPYHEPIITSIYLNKPLEKGEILKYPENVLMHSDGTTESVTLPKIPTFEGTTIIETATEIQPENMEITYKSRR